MYTIILINKSGGFQITMRKEIERAHQFVALAKETKKELACAFIYNPVGKLVFSGDNGEETA